SLALLVVLTLLAIPTYFSGDHAMTTLGQDPKVSKDVMDSHYGWGVTALAMLVITGIAALINLWRFRGKEPVSENAMHLVLGLALVTLGLMVVVDELGWDINHHELQLAPAANKTPQIWSHV